MGVHGRHQKIDFLLQTAAKVFYVQGFHGTKMEHVAKAAGVSKGVLYFYFRNKEDLFIALVHFAIQKVHGFTIELFKEIEHENGLQQVTIFAERYFTLNEHFPEIQYLTSEYIQMSHPSRQQGIETGITSGMKESEYYQKILNIQFDTSLIIIGAIQKGQQEGTILNLTEPKLIYATLWSMLLGYEKLSVAESYFHEIISEQASIFHIDRKIWQNFILKSIQSILKNKS